MLLYLFPSLAVTMPCRRHTNSLVYCWLLSFSHHTLFKSSSKKHEPAAKLVKGNNHVGLHDALLISFRLTVTLDINFAEYTETSNLGLYRYHKVFSLFIFQEVKDQTNYLKLP